MTCTSIERRPALEMRPTSVLEFARALLRRFLAWRRRRLDRRHLLDLDERLLRDIGLTRTEVTHGLGGNRSLDSWR
jgi:uncharacterized protein YjiS (DUF1127 family)